MAQTTTNYGFKKPEPNDFYNVEDQNENWDKVDEMITCGTEDLVAGTSALKTGTLYFVYE